VAVLRAGSHDELGATPYVILADGDGVEHYARFRAGVDLPSHGETVKLVHGERRAELLQTMGA
jgi:hypothetical protein